MVAAGALSPVLSVALEPDLVSAGVVSAGASVAASTTWRLPRVEPSEKTKRNS